jgi:hypothetical protein
MASERMLTSDRLIVIGRHALPWLVGSAALILRRSPAEIVTPSRCPGLLELMSLAAVRLQPDWGVGRIFELLQVVAIVFAVAAFVGLVRRATRSGIVAVATGFAVALSPLFAFTVAPPWEAAAFGMCAAIALMFSNRPSNSGHNQKAVPYLRGGVRPGYTPIVFGSTIFLMTAVIVPAWIVLAALGTGLVTWIALSKIKVSARSLAALSASLSVLALSCAILMLSPPDRLAGPPTWHALASCALPLAQATTSDLVALTSSVTDMAGPFVLALGALGLFLAARRAGVRRNLAAAAIALTFFFLAATSLMSPRIMLAPIVISIWSLAALGADEVVSAIGPGPVRRVVGLAFLALLPALQIARLDAEERDDWMRPQGHEQVTLRQITAVLNVVSADATFVEEDAAIDILLRAAVFGGRRASKPFSVIRPLPDAIEQAMNAGRVYAFPNSQQILTGRGFAIEPIPVTLRRNDRDLTAIDGLAEITALRPCRTVGRSWVEVGETSKGGRTAMAADAESARGPIVVYLGGRTAVEPRPDGWPPRTTRGFRFSLFDQRDEARSNRLQAELREAGLSSEHPVTTSPFVVKLILHRTPHAPLLLAVVLGAAFPVGVAKLDEGVTEAEHLTLCDAPAVKIAPFATRVE